MTWALGAAACFGYIVVGCGVRRLARPAKPQGFEGIHAVFKRRELEELATIAGWFWPIFLFVKFAASVIALIDYLVFESWRK